MPFEFAHLGYVAEAVTIHRIMNQSAGATRPDYADLFSLARYAEPELVAALAAQSRVGEL